MKNLQKIPHYVRNDNLKLTTFGVKGLGTQKSLIETYSICHISSSVFILNKTTQQKTYGESNNHT